MKMPQEENSERNEEPLEPDLFEKRYNPRNLIYSLNGHGQQWRPAPFEEAIGPDGRQFVRKVGTQIIYEVYLDKGIGKYSCINCNSLTDYIMTSRQIHLGLGINPHIRCEPHHYCPNCESKPSKRNLSKIDETELNR